VNNPLAHTEFWFGLFGGLAFFLFGMDIMTRALKRVAGEHLKSLLGALTRNRFIAVAVGAFVTAIIQSSSVTTVILVGFISAGLLSMSQSVAVIMGANIGTTVTAQILAFNVTQFALPVITLGFLVSFAPKHENWRQYGLMMLGLGLIFYGMAIMSEAVRPLQSYGPFIAFMTTMQNPVLAVLAGAVFTAVIQSSSATTGILIVLAGQGLIGLETAIAIVLGANIGTCITAILAAIGKPREAVRAAAVHTLFNVAGVLIWVAFIPQLTELARIISPTDTLLSGTAKNAAEMPRQIANIHTFFNVTNTLIFIGFTTQIARLVEWLIPDRPLSESMALTPKYLDEALLSTPSIALDSSRREVVRLGEWVRDLLTDVLPVALSQKSTKLESITTRHKAIDNLYREIIGFLARISNRDLSAVSSDELMTLIQIANDLKYIAERTAIDIVTSTRKSLREGVMVSDETAILISQFHKEILKEFVTTLKAVADQDENLAAGVRSKKQYVAEMKRKIAVHEVERLTAHAPKRLATYTHEIETVDILHGIFKIIRHIAGTLEQIEKTQPA